jgi:anaerobic ribonucleoside-triphosphate reductase activating protein
MEEDLSLRSAATQDRVRLAGIVNESVSDGPGLRIALFFQGCAHHCPGCHNPHTWNFDGGQEYQVIQLLRNLPDTPLIKGVTLSGGDPFYQPQAAATIAREFRVRGKDVWAYTGFTWEELVESNDLAVLELLYECDVLVDGPFVQSLRSVDLPYRGSANQRLIAVPESLQTAKVVEYHGR